MTDPVYHYTDFTPANSDPWMRFDVSPPLGAPGPDFPLWGLDGVETSLKAQWAANRLTVVEFGSFT